MSNARGFFLALVLPYLMLKTCSKRVKNTLKSLFFAFIFQQLFFL